MTLRSMRRNGPGFQASYPVSLTLSNAGLPILYLSFTGLQKIELGMANVSSYGLLLKAHAAPPDEAAHHFRFSFQPGVLDNAQLGALALAESQWALTAKPDASGGTTLYVASVDGRLFDPQETIALTLLNVTVAANATLSLTQVGMTYRLTNVKFERELTGRRTAFLQMVPGGSGAGAPPLWFGFNGSDTVLNDGVTANALSLLVANAAETGELRLTPSTMVNPTRFLLRFATQGEGETRPWSLGNVSQVQGITVQPPGAGWSVEYQGTGDVPQWAITTSETSLPAGRSAEFALTGIVSGMADGPATVFLDYENLPGFADGQVTTAIHKGAVVARDWRIGIRGMPNAHGAALSVAGPVAADAFVQSDGVRLVSLPIGTILMWYGKLTDIPTGWYLCRGLNGTPDLTDRMPMGAGGLYPPGTSGGSATKVLSTENLPAHGHGYDRFTMQSSNWLSGGHETPWDGTGRVEFAASSLTGAGKAFDVLPPFTAVYFIMKVSNSGTDH